MHNTPVIVIEDEHPAHLAKLEEFKKEWRELWKEKFKACEQTSETWHDNPAFDAVEMKQNMLSNRMWELSKILNNVQILTFEVIRSNSNEFVSIWKKITVLIDDEEKVFEIGWFHTPNGNRVSYNAPIIQPLIWKEEWDDVKVEIWWKVKEISILSIENI